MNTFKQNKGDPSSPLEKAKTAKLLANSNPQTLFDRAETRLFELLPFFNNADLEAFLKYFDHPFLIQLSEATSENDQAAYFTKSGDSSAVALRPDLGKCRVIPVTKKGGGSFRNMISVGRSNNNDLVFTVSRISKLHAFFQKRADGWVLTDCNSSNHTFVLGRKLTPHKAQLLTSPTEINFAGQLSVLFVEPKEMLSQIHELIKS